jgi:hypothetical protein
VFSPALAANYSAAANSIEVRIMKKFAAVLALLVPVALAGCSHPQQVYYAAPPPPPAAVISQFSQQGFDDGFRAAAWDIRHHRAADPDSHKEFRKPHVPAEFVAEYRHGFSRGYDQTFHYETGARPNNY